MLLFLDDDWIALDKPTGLPTTPPTRRGATLLDAARARCPHVKNPHPLSRLDADVTGVVLFALSPKAIALAEYARASATYHRLYLGLASPAPREDAGSWRGALSIDPRDPTLRTTAPGRDTVDAWTDFAVLSRADAVALLRFTPVTGRTHQIRAHARAAGTSLLGDIHYGGARRITRDDGAVCSAARAMLHAWRVRVPGSDRLIEAPPHPDMRALWECAGGSPEAFAQ